MALGSWQGPRGTSSATAHPGKRVSFNRSPNEHLSVGARTTSSLGTQLLGRQARHKRRRSSPSQRCSGFAWSSAGQDRVCPEVERKGFAAECSTRGGGGRLRPSTSSRPPDLDETSLLSLHCWRPCRLQRSRAELRCGRFFVRGGWRQNRCWRS